MEVERAGVGGSGGGEEGAGGEVKKRASKASRASAAKAEEQQPAAAAPPPPPPGPSNEEPEPPKGKLADVKNCCNAVCNFLWNPEKKTVMGRGGKRWGYLCIFYILFYLTIFSFFAAFFYIILLTMDVNEPTEVWKPAPDGQRGIFEGHRIQQNPAMIIFPGQDREKNPDSPVIWINKDNYKYWSSQIDSQIKGYKTYKDKNKCSDCFEFNTSASSNCVMGPDYGYDVGQPTFIIRIGKMIKWKPKGFKDLKDLKDHMKKHFKDTEISNQMTYLEKQFQDAKASGNGDSVIVICEGETPTDIGLMGGVTYCTGNLLEAKYFPYKHGKHAYLSPFIMVQFRNPVPGIPITVECYPIAKNIDVDKRLRHGVEKFEFMMD